MHCKDCKFWENLTDPWCASWHECSAAEWLDGRVKPTGTGFGYYAEELDDSGLSAGFKTAPMFGCIKFTPKETT